MMYYVRLCRGLKDIGHLVAFDQNPLTYITDVLEGSLEDDWYSSIFFYTEEHKQAAEEIITVTNKYDKQITRPRGIEGITDVVTNKLIFDFDSEDLEEARGSAIELCSRILMQSGGTIGPDNLQISFSGSKGFHVELEVDKYLSQTEFKNIVHGIAGDLPAFDTVIWNASRVFRVVGTKHPSTGLYKFPLTLKQLTQWDIDFIKEKAQDIDNMDEDVFDGWYGVELPEGLYKMREALVEPTKEIELEDHSLDLSLKPRWLTEPKYAIQEGYFEKGNRNTAFMILAATYKNQGFDKELIYRMLKGVAAKQAARTGDKRFSDYELWNNITLEVCKPGWKGGQYPKDHPLLIEIAEKYSLDVGMVQDEELIPVEDVSSIFKDFAVNIEKNTMKLGIDVIDSNVTITTSMLVGLLAAPSAGKTSIAVDILNNASSRDINSIFFSLDMGAPQVFQRLIQKHTGEDSKVILKNYSERNEDKIQEYAKIVESEYTNTKFCFRSGLDTEDIRKIIINEEENSGEKIKLVVVDYLECIQGPYSDPTANTSMIAQRLKDIANDLKLTVLLLLQPQKHAGDPADELLSYRKIKGSSAIEQAASVVFTMWRPGFSAKHPEDDKYLSIAVVKNRMGGLHTFDFSWEGVRGTIEELDGFEENELKKLRDRRAREKAAQSSF